MNAFKNAWTLYREKGLRGLWYRICNSFWKRKEYVVYRKDINDLAPYSTVSGYRFVLADFNDLRWLCDQRDDLGDSAEEIIRQQFNETDITVIGITEGNPEELVFSVWISHEDYFLSLLNTYVGEADASLRRVWVRPTRRRSGVAAMGLSFSEYAAREAGISGLWSLVVHDNMASRRLHEKMGYESCGRIQLIKICRRRYVKIHTVWQRLASRRMLPKGVVRL